MIFDYRHSPLWVTFDECRLVTLKDWSASYDTLSTESLLHGVPTTQRKTCLAGRGVHVQVVKIPQFYLKLLTKAFKHMGNRNGIKNAKWHISNIKLNGQSGVRGTWNGYIRVSSMTLGNADSNSLRLHCVIRETRNFRAKQTVCIILSWKSKLQIIEGRW